MWGYYGSKSKIVSKYDPPKYDHIIEPFAGTAQYALKYFEKDVTLIDKYDVVVNLWKWLQQCSEKDILKIRQLKCGESTDDFEWSCTEEKNLIGFIIGGAPTTPRKKASKWKTLIRPNTQQYKLELISKSLFKIKHWNIIQGDYSESPNVRATWFIDPPYVIGGKHYKFGSKLLNYNDLAKWCLGREGQVIVCEGDNADWLPFEYLLQSHGNKNEHKEYIFKKEG